jgi:hypothetical protein
MDLNGYFYKITEPSYHSIWYYRTLCHRHSVSKCEVIKITNLWEQYVSEPLWIRDNFPNSYFKNHTSSSELSEGEGEESVEFSAVPVRSTSSMLSVGKKQHFFTTEFLKKSDYTKTPVH